MFENFFETIGIALGFLFLLSLAICAGRTRVENSKLRKKYALMPYTKNPLVHHSLRESTLLRQYGISRKPRRMLTMGPEDGPMDDGSQNCKEAFGLKDPRSKNPDRRTLEKALLENEIVKQRLLACLYKYDPYYEYY